MRHVFVKGFAHPRDDLYSKKRVAPQLKEVIVDAYLVELEYVPPNLSDQLVTLCLGFNETLVEQRPFAVRRRQRLSINLSVGCYR